ncbi:mRNA 3' end processing factor [Leucoagaricus gongylophorus]
MSLYSQNYYDQPSYGGPTYAVPAPQSGYQYQYPHHPPPHISPQPVFIDPASFRRDYSSRLEQLQFNSRPIIQNLSFYAQEYSRYADIVAQCLDNHIRKVSPWIKLPAFYLLDAISKNVYDPYARVFASFVIPLFLETYRSVDNNIRSKMDEMLLTWRTGAPNGKELFGLAPQMAIERGIWGEQARPNQVTKVQVMTELNFTLQAKERAIQFNPNDVTSKHHLQVLVQLRNLVEAGVSQDELSQILAQLRGLARPPTVQPVPPLQPQWPTPQLSSTLTTYPHPSYNTVYLAPTPEKFEPAASPAPGLPASAPTENAAGTNLQISNILSSLMKSGLVSAVDTTSEPKAPLMEQEPEEVKSPVPSAEDLTAIKDAQTDYRERILAERVETSSVENSIDDPTNVSFFLYDYLPLQCQQCGMRYPDTILGRKHLEDHLDLHFRQNHKLSQNPGRGHDRSWFTSVEDWVHESSRDATNKPRTSRSTSLRVKALTTVEGVEQGVNVELRYVTVPPGDEAKLLSHPICPICKETLQVEFLEEEEEWIWRNAIKKDDKVYHATCHREATTSASNLVTRLKSEFGTGSRASTPEVTSSGFMPPFVRRSPSRSPLSSPPKLVGTKRKVERELSTEAGHTPPFKKLALA